MGKKLFTMEQNLEQRPEQREGRREGEGQPSKKTLAGHFHAQHFIFLGFQAFYRYFNCQTPALRAVKWLWLLLETEERISAVLDKRPLLHIAAQYG